MSGMMVADYLQRRLVQSPIAFRVNFHAHYPLVNIGIWPPLYFSSKAGGPP
jgi:hypothetical protein